MKVVFVTPATSHEQICGDWDLSAMVTCCPLPALLCLAVYRRTLGRTRAVLDQEPSRRDTGPLPTGFLEVRAAGCGIKSLRRSAGSSRPCLMGRRRFWRIAGA